MKEQFEFLHTPNTIFHMTFDHLNQGNYDTGFQTVQIHGKDHHQLTRDITLTMQTFREGNLVNILFSKGEPMHVQLDDEITPYYSDYIECRYVLEGHLALEFDGELEYFNENEICFITSSACHRESISNSEGVFINIFISRSFFNEKFLNSVSLTPLQKFLRTNLLQKGQQEKCLKFVPTPSDIDTVKEYVFQIFKEVRFQKTGYLDVSRVYIIRLIDILAEKYQRDISTSKSSQYYDSLFASVSEFMKDNLQTMTMERLIDEFHFQSNFFNKLIKKYTGLTYSAYLVSLRVERTKQLLDTTDLNVDEIIWLVGYYNKGYFYHKFKDITGVSPAKYRKSIKKDMYH